VITASKENLYQSQKAITYRFYFELTIAGLAQEKTQAAKAWAFNMSYL